MEDYDTLTYHVKRTSQVKTTEQSLITQERNQKLDLLTHLLANLAQSLVVCGPQGIGKTTLLKILQERQVNSWVYCPVQGHADLSFEKILQQIGEVINRESPKSDTPLAAALGQLGSRNTKIILIIDDAGELVPGLITALIQYATANPVLRVVFVLTHDALYVKNRTDRAIEDCHLIEIPPLSEKQCGDFLQHLAAKSSSPIAFNSISDSLIEKIYRKTHGIPGKILAELPDLPVSKQGQNPTAILVSAVAALVVIALGLQWYSAQNYQRLKTPETVKTQHPAAKAAAASPQPLPGNKSEPMLLTEQFGQQKNTDLFSVPQQTATEAKDDNQAVSDNSNTAENNPPASANAVNGSAKPENTALPDSLKEPLPTNKDTATAAAAGANQAPLPQQPSTETDANSVISEQEMAAEPAAPEQGENWVLSQPPENFTLQVMVLTKEQAIKNVINQHQALEQPLTYFKTVSPNGKEKFLLLYGSFASADEAMKARQSLPPEFRRSYPRKFNSVKNSTPHQHH